MLKFARGAWKKLASLFQAGLTPHKLSLSVSASLLISLFPVFGIAGFVLTSLAIPLRLNLPIMIVLSYMIEPLKILLMIPFINLGASIFGTEHTLLTYEAIKASYATGFFRTVKALLYELVCGSVGWAITVLPVSILFFLLLKLLLTKILHRKSAIT